MNLEVALINSDTDFINKVCVYFFASQTHFPQKKEGNEFERASQHHFRQRKGGK